MIKIRQETMRDVEAREALLDACFGADAVPEDLRAPARRPRAGARACRSSSSATASLVGTVRLWHVSPARTARRCCSARSPSIRPARAWASAAKLMREALARATALGHEAVLLVGRRGLLRALRLLGGQHRRVCGCRARTSASASSGSNSRPAPSTGARGLVSATRRARAEAGSRSARRRRRAGHGLAGCRSPPEHSLDN